MNILSLKMNLLKIHPIISHLRNYCHRVACGRCLEQIRFSFRFKLIPITKHKKFGEFFLVTAPSIFARIISKVVNVDNDCRFALNF